jgi:hypothetical protein
MSRPERDASNREAIRAVRADRLVVIDPSRVAVVDMTALSVTVPGERLAVYSALMRRKKTTVPVRPSAWEHHRFGLKRITHI